jgi:hypothetical protein
MDIRALRKQILTAAELREMQFWQRKPHEIFKSMEALLNDRHQDFKPFTHDSNGDYSFKRAEAFVIKLLSYYEAEFQPYMWGASDEEWKRLEDEYDKIPYDELQKMEYEGGPAGPWFYRGEGERFAEELKCYKAYLHIAVRYLAAFEDHKQGWAKNKGKPVLETNFAGLCVKTGMVGYDGESVLICDQLGRTHLLEEPLDFERTLLGLIDAHNFNDLFTTKDLKPYYDVCVTFFEELLELKKQHFTGFMEDYDPVSALLFTEFPNAIQFMVDAFLYDHKMVVLSDKEAFLDCMVALDKTRKIMVAKKNN